MLAQRMQVTGRPSVGPSAILSARCRVRATATPQSNISTAPTSKVQEFAHSGLSRREQLQLEAKRALEAADSWWKTGPTSPNVVVATSPQHFKSLVVDCTSPRPIVVAYFFSPQCHACKTLYPKLQQIAANNSDVTFVKINTADRALSDLAKGMQVAKLPWFIIMSAGTGEQLASFTANVSSVSNLRAEIAAAKECTSPGCSELY